MKKRLLTGLLLSAFFVLGACSEDKATGQEVDDAVQQEQQQETEVNNNVLVFEVDGEEKEEELVSMNLPSGLVQTVYMTDDFETVTQREDLYQFYGSGVYEEFLFGVGKEKITSSLGLTKTRLKKSLSTPNGEERTEVMELNLDEYPGLAEKYDMVIEADRALGSRYDAFKFNEEKQEIIRVAVAIPSDEQEKYRGFALKLIEKVELSEPAE